jgi:hypothetical protein
MQVARVSTCMDTLVERSRMRRTAATETLHSKMRRTQPRAHRPKFGHRVCRLENEEGGGRASGSRALCANRKAWRRS